MGLRIFALALCALAVPSVTSATECWALTGLKGQSGVSVDGYVFTPDGFSNPMVLCFNDDDEVKAAEAPQKDLPEETVASESGVLLERGEPFSKRVGQHPIAQIGVERDRDASVKRLRCFNLPRVNGTLVINCCFQNRETCPMFCIERDLNE